jgi:hypothetical protein
MGRRRARGKLWQHNVTTLRRELGKMWREKKGDFTESTATKAKHMLNKPLSYIMKKKINCEGALSHEKLLHK